MGQTQGFHQRLQACRADAVASKALGGFLDDALMGLGFMVLRVTHRGKSPQLGSHLTQG